MFTVIDTETNGLDTQSADVLQFAYLTFDSYNNPVDSGSMYFFYEGMHIDPGALAVNKLSYEYLKQYKSEFLDNIIRMFTVMNNNILVGYNSDGFDIPLIRNFLMRNGAPMPILRNMENQDAMKFALPLYKDASSKYKKLVVVSEKFGFTEDVILTKAAEWFPGITVRGAHDAVYDVTATALITLYCLEKGAVNLNKKRLPAQVKEAEYVDVDEVFTQPTVNMNFGSVPAVQLFENAVHKVVPNLGVLNGDPILYSNNGYSVVYKRNDNGVHIVKGDADFVLIPESVNLFKKLLGEV